MLLSLYSIRTGKILSTGKNVHDVLRKYIAIAYKEQIEHNDSWYSEGVNYIHIAKYIINMYLKGHICTEIL